MGGPERQQRQFVLLIRPAAAVVAFASFAALYAVRPSEGVRNFLVAVAAFALTTIPASWLAARRLPIATVTRAILFVDILMVAMFVYVLDRESLLVAVYSAPIAFGALMFGPYVTVALGALALAASAVVLALREYDSVVVVADLVLLVVLTGALAALSQELRRGRRRLEVDAAALAIAERFRESLDLDVVLRHAVEDLAGATGAMRVRLRLAPRGDGSAPLYHWERPGLEPLELPSPPPLTLRTLETRDPLVVDTEDSRADAALRAYVREFDARSYLGYPILWQERAVAAIGIFDDRRRRWGRTIALLDRVVPQLATAVVQSELFREQQVTAAMREELVANVSHELRTPLTATIGFLKTLEREDVHLEPEQRREFLAVARREAERLARLVSDLLHLTRLERGAIALAREPASLSAVVARAAREVDVPDGRAIRVDVPPEIVAVVDADRLLQVFSNLLTNGIRHGAGDVRVSGEDRGDRVHLLVRDEGPGVQPAHATTMFEPFARWSRHTDSSGLGLAIARRLVEAHGGTLTYRDRTDATPHAFVVDLPRASAG